MIIDLLTTFFFFIAVILFGLMPFPLLYGLSNLTRLIVYNLMDYRKDIVKKNLEESFPGINSNELARLTRLFYKNLADIFLEGIKAFTMTRNQILRRHRIINPELLDELYQSGRNIIGVTGHYANWEWGSLSPGLQTKYKVVAFYKPLSNKYINKFVLWSRSRFGTTLAPIKETSLTFENYKDTRTIFLMAADQSVSEEYRDKAYWLQFLNHDTAFLHGMEKHSRNNNLPVLYADVQRVKRGYYTIELSVLTLNPLKHEEGALTEMYARKLESIILKKPEDWLWSHRRWKITR
jgi:Kdo2-lipid IVA lauroyltransferase/acyltransferase